MRPKSRKSNESDVSSKRLSTNMKPQTKSRSSESLGKSIDASGKRSPLAHHVLNTTRNVRLRRAPGSEESLGQTSQGRFTRQRAKANLFSGTSQVKNQPKYVLIPKNVNYNLPELFFSCFRLHWWKRQGIFCQTKFQSSLMEVL